ncbi:MAG: hypothetical protein V1859_00905 [archaeon]
MTNSILMLISYFLFAFLFFAISSIIDFYYSNIYFFESGLLITSKFITWHDIVDFNKKNETIKIHFNHYHHRDNDKKYPSIQTISLTPTDTNFVIQELLKKGIKSKT